MTQEDEKSTAENKGEESKNWLVGRDEWLTKLAISAQDGDKEAYRELLTEIKNILTGYLLRRLADKSGVDDVIQEILISIHKGLHTFIKGRSFSAWMYAIAKNRLYDFLRVKKRRQREVSEADIGFDDFVFEPESTMSFEDMSQHLEKALKSIPQKYAEAIRLTKIEGLSVKEACIRMQMKESALKVTVHRAYKMLKEKLVAT